MSIERFMNVNETLKYHIDTENALVHGIVILMQS